MHCASIAGRISSAMPPQTPVKLAWATTDPDPGQVVEERPLAAATAESMMTTAVMLEQAMGGEDKTCFSI